MNASRDHDTVHNTVHNTVHDKVDRLLPWYVNGTLNAVERNEVERHLESCERCAANLAMLTDVGLAVQNAGPTPLIPEPDAGVLFDAIDRAASRQRRRLAVYGLAASLIVAAVVMSVLLPAGGPPDTSPAQFETASSGDGGTPTDYVFEVRFNADAGLDARAAVFDTIAAREIVALDDSDTYRVIVRLPAASLSELETFTLDIESRPAVDSVDVVAVQLPMQPER